MDETDKTRLLEEFRQYLDATTVVEEETGQTDLFSLFGELAALRTEVDRIRQFRTALDTIGRAHEPEQPGEAGRTVGDFRANFPLSAATPASRCWIYDLRPALRRPRCATTVRQGWFRISHAGRPSLHRAYARQGMSLRRLEKSRATKRSKSWVCRSTTA